MKVLFVNHTIGVGSTGRICTELAQKLEDEGHECRIAYGRGRCAEKFERFAKRIGSDLQVYKNALSTRFFDNDGLTAKAATRKFVRWAESYDPDLLWLHNIHGYYLNYEILFAWIKSRPQMEVRWTLHDCWTFTGHCAHFSVAKCEQWKTQCQACVQKREYPGSLLIDNCKRNFERKKKAFTGVQKMTLITPSRWLADLVKQSFLKDYPVEVHYNTIDKAVFKPTPSDFRERHGLQGKVIVLGVANVWHINKGLNDFLKLASKLDKKYIVVLVGLTKKQLERLPANIVGIERTASKTELAEIYTAADVFVNPTYEDTYPTVNLEAQACGTPVVTYDTGGCRETLSEGGGVGVVVPVGDTEAVIRQILGR